MKKLILSGAIAGALFTAASSEASFSLQLSNGIGGPNSALILPGQSFDLTVTLVASDANDTSVGLDYWLQTVEAAGNGKFTITARSIAGSSFSIPNTDNSIALASPDNVLSPSNVDNLGAILNDPTTPNTGAGNFFVADLTVQSASNIPTGTYTIETTSSASQQSDVSDANFNTLPVAAGTYSVTVAPEPASAALLMTAALGLAIRRRRSR